MYRTYSTDTNMCMEWLLYLNLFYSVKDILDGIDSIFAPLVDLANDAIAELLKFLPSFSLPGMFESSIHLRNFLVFGVKLLRVCALLTKAQRLWLQQSCLYLQGFRTLARSSTSITTSTSQLLTLTSALQPHSSGWAGTAAHKWRMYAQRALVLCHSTAPSHCLPTNLPSHGVGGKDRLHQPLIIFRQSESYKSNM